MPKRPPVRSPQREEISRLRAEVERLRGELAARSEAEAPGGEGGRRFKELADLLPEALFEVEPDGRIAFSNPKGFELFGYAPADLKQGLNALDLVAPDDRARAAENARSVLGGAEVGLQEYTLLRKDGSTFPAVVHAAPLRRQGQVQGQLGIVLDLGQRKTAEEALARSESTLRAILESSPVGVGLTQGRRLIWSNEAMPRMLGYYPGEIIGRDVSMFYEDQAEYQRAWLELTRSLSHRPVGSTEARLRRKDGRVIQVEIFLRPMDPADLDKGVIAVLMDVTERKLSQQALQAAHDQLEERVTMRTRELEEAIRSLRREIVHRREMEEDIRQSERRYHQLFTEMSAGFALHDIILDQTGRPVDYRFVQVNPAFERLTGLAAEQILGKTILEILPKTERRWIEQFGRVALGGGSVHLERYSRALDTFFDVSAFSPKRGQFATTFTDVSQRKRVERVLRQNEEYLSEVLDGMQAGVAIIDAEAKVIAYVNKYAARLIGAPRDEIVGRVCHRFICPAQEGQCPAAGRPEGLESSERVLLTAGGREIPILKSVSAVRKLDKTFLVESFIDISDMKRLLREQELSISRAKSILAFTNGVPPRHTDLGRELELVACAVALPCHQEGGDHFFVREMPASAGREGGRTVFSVKDQSGHKVGCILRSINTDLLHQAILDQRPAASLEETTALLNRKLGEHDILGGRHFVTALVGEIDHRTLLLRYLLCGHPNFLVVRGGRALLLPEEDGPGRNLPLGALRDAAFQAGQFQLQAGDRIMVFTDGLLDALSPQAPAQLGGREAGQRLREMVTSLIRGRQNPPVMDIMEGALAMAARVSGKPIHPAGVNGSDDDITILGLEVLDKGERDGVELRAADLAELQEKIDGLLESLGPQWDRDGYGDPLRLRYALSEALVNAWKHGGGGDPHQPIQVRYRFGSDLCLEIADQGPGFSHQAVEDPRYGRHLTRTTGRGLLLINRHATTVAFNQRGNAVRLTFDRRPDSGHSLQGLDLDRHAFAQGVGINQ